MMIQLWEILFLLILVPCLILGALKGFLRMVTLLAAHLFSCTLALVFSPDVTRVVNDRMDWDLNTHLYSFLILYLVPMILVTQLFRVLYGKAEKGPLLPPGRAGGVVAGTLLGIFFCLLLSWVMLIQPFVPLGVVFSLGGFLFSRTTRILQFFMGFYV